MKVSLTVGVIVGVATGGVILLCTIAIFVIRLVLRIKHERELTRIATEIEGRLSRVSSSFMDISDDDVARMPGTSAAVQRSLQPQQNKMSSPRIRPRGMVESRPVMKSLERVKASSRSERDVSEPVQSWPLPRRLTRSDGTPFANPPISSTSLRKRLDDKPYFSRKAIERKDPQGAFAHSNQNRMTPVDQSNVELKPRPLFHGHQHSKSQITSPQSAQTDVAAVSQDVDTKDFAPKDIPRTRHIRSSSVCSQDPGAVPTHMLPPLPFEMLPNGNRNMKSPTDFSACESLFSDNTSVLNDEESRVLSEAETDLTSIGIASPYALTPASKSPKGKLGLWDAAALQEKANFAQASKNPSLRPNLNTSKSFRGSIQYTLPSNRSSGLSMSLLDHASNGGSNCNSPRDQSAAEPKSKLSPIYRTDRRKPDPGISHSSPLRNVNVSEHTASPKGKRASFSALKQITGNEGGPIMSVEDKRTSSTIAEDPFDVRTSIPPATNKRGSNAEEVQKNRQTLRLSPLRRPSSPVTAGADRAGDSAKTSGTVIQEPQYGERSIHPPSKPTFDLQFSPHRGRLSTLGHTPPFSPTVATFSYYEGYDDSSPESVIATPTKKPSRRASSSNRLSVFDNPFTTSWRLPSAPSEQNMDSSTKDLEPQRPQEQMSENDPDSRPSSFLFDFPNPPKQNTYPSRRGPKTPIRGIHGPRPLPLDLHRPSRRRSKRSSSHSPSKSPSQSPTRSPSARISKLYGTSPNFDLRRSIMTLRRQNSEVNNHQSKSSREHKRYLSIGDLSDHDRDSVCSGMVGKEDGEEGSGGKGLKDVLLSMESEGVSTPKRWRGGVIRVDTPSSFYDGEGFFQED